MKTWYDWDKDVLNIDFGKGNVKAFTREFLKDVSSPTTGRHYSTIVADDGPYFNIKERNTMNEAYETNTQMNTQANEYARKLGLQGNMNGFGSLSQETKAWFNSGDLVACKPILSTPTKMKRLTSYNDWTILVENDKLVAVSSTGETIRAVGSLISAGGKAWMWKNARLYSGELAEVLTEQQEAQQKKEAAQKAVIMKYEKMLDKNLDKAKGVSSEYDKIRTQRDKELQAL